MLISFKNTLKFHPGDGLTVCLLQSEWIDLFSSCTLLGSTHWPWSQAALVGSAVCRRRASQRTPPVESACTPHSQGTGVGRSCVREHAEISCKRKETKDIWTYGLWSLILDIIYLSWNYFLTEFTFREEDGLCLLKNWRTCRDKATLLVGQIHFPPLLLQEVLPLFSPQFLIVQIFNVLKSWKNILWTLMYPEPRPSDSQAGAVEVCFPAGCLFASNSF